MVVLCIVAGPAVDRYRKTRTLMPVWDSSGESRFHCSAPRWDGKSPSKAGYLGNVDLVTGGEKWLTGTRCIHSSQSGYANEEFSASPFGLSMSACSEGFKTTGGSSVSTSRPGGLMLFARKGLNR